MSQERPRSVVATIWLLEALIVLCVAGGVAAVVFKGQLVDAWDTGRPDAGSVEPPAFAAVAVVMFTVVAMLVFVLMAFFKSRYGWSRVVLTALAVVLCIAALSTLNVGPPALFVALSVASMALDVAVVVCLWHRDTGAYLAGPDRISTGP